VNYEKLGPVLFFGGVVLAAVVSPAFILVAGIGAIILLG
jgi:hypothetical protein